MADPRELYGASPWHRAVFDLLAEEVARISHAALMSGMVFALPAEITEASADGHNASLRPTIKKVVLDPVTGQKTYQDHPIAPDTPVHFPGGAGTVLTHGLAAGDEVANLYFSRQIDSWRQLGGSQQPYDEVQNHLGDSVAIPGIRSDPRKLQQVSSEAMHLRAESKLHVHELHPTNGITHFSADPSTPAASSSFDPFLMATKFYRHIVQGAAGILGSATDGGTTHEHGVTHTDGAFMRALNGLHAVLAHPTQGALLSAENGQHTVTASPSGVMLSSISSIGLSAPSLSLPAGSVGGSSLGSGAAASNVGALSGDVTGTLPNVQVVGLGNVDARTLPIATSDAAAATAGVAVGGLYRDTSIALGKTVVVMRAA